MIFPFCYKYKLWNYILFSIQCWFSPSVLRINYLVFSISHYCFCCYYSSSWSIQCKMSPFLVRRYFLWISFFSSYRSSISSSHSEFSPDHNLRKYVNTFYLRRSLLIYRFEHYVDLLPCGLDNMLIYCFFYCLTWCSQFSLGWERHSDLRLYIISKSFSVPQFLNSSVISSSLIVLIALQLFCLFFRCLLYYWSQKGNICLLHMVP